jgi:hypothetical protein
MITLSPSSENLAFQNKNCLFQLFKKIFINTDYHTVRIAFFPTGELCNSLIFLNVCSNPYTIKHCFHFIFKILILVLRIHDILGWIRIRIRGSMPLTNGSRSGIGSWIRILLFSSLTFKMPAKN